MRPRILLAVWLLVVWVALWRDVSVANLVSGALLAGAVIWLFPPANDAPLGVRPLALVRFVGATAVSILRANLVVAWEVLTPSNRINEGVVAVELESSNPTVITLVSHAIILAPGTMVIDIDKGTDTRPTKLFVHVLHLRTVDEVRDEVLKLEALALAAVSGRDDPAPTPPTDGGAR
jgi:multicomponent Na+:H+ antiporter subunit E